MAFYAFPLAQGDRILTGRAEYASNWIALKQVAARTGASIEVVPDDEHGQFDVNALEGLLDERVKLVSLVHVPTQSGLVNPAAAVGRVTARGGRAAAARCLPVGRPAAGRCGRDRLRRPLGHRTQVSARAARNGLSLRPPRADRDARATVPRHARCRVGARRRATASASTRGGSRTGRPTTRGRSDSASPSTTHSSSGSPRSGRACRRSLRACARA